MPHDTMEAYRLQPTKNLGAAMLDVLASTQRLEQAAMMAGRQIDTAPITAGIDAVWKQLE